MRETTSPGAVWRGVLEMAVRDYELDMQGIVNNANYQHYFEHARHEYLRSLGLDFAAMHADGLDPVVYRIEIDYRRPLQSGERFLARLRVERDGRLKLVFHQEIIKLGSGETAASARVVVAMTRLGRPVPVDEGIARLLVEGRCEA